MKLTVLLLAAIMPLSGCLLVPVDGDRGERGDHRGHEHDRDGDRERHCDHDGHCEERRHD